ncbi:MAG TPA: hypothetical protein VIX19_04625 [Terriglobales bacterium]
MKHGIWLVTLMASTSVYGQQTPEVTTQQKFLSGGTIRLHLEAGGYIISPSDSDKIVITCQHRSEEKLKGVEVSIRPSGTTADVYIRNTPNNNFTATIEVPRRSNLWARLTAGELSVGTVEGDKDIRLNAGSLVVDIPRPQDYGLREASVATGSISAPAFEESRDGLFRSFRQHGPGKYRLHVYVMAGEINLRATS